MIDGGNQLSAEAFIAYFFPKLLLLADTTVCMFVLEIDNNSEMIRFKLASLN